MIDRKELVEKMVGVYEQHGRVCGLDPAEELFFNERRQAMDAALSVAVDELLPDPTTDESNAALKEQAEFERTMTERHKYTFTHSVAMRIIANRRAQLERVKTPEERVTVKPKIGVRDDWNVFLDDERKYTFDNMADAYTYRLGLIQQLKGSA